MKKNWRNVITMEKQIDLDGKPIEREVDENEPTVSVWKSALQKAIRRCETEKAMYAALELLEKGGSWITWKRLSVIADEDVGQPEIITAIDTLYRKFNAMRKPKEEKKGYSWDEKRCVVLAAKILAEAPKDRRADEFLELLDAIEKNSDKIPNLKLILENWMPSDKAYDMHTKEGREMGRGLEYWYKVSSRCENMTPKYEEWRSWWEPLMLEILKRKKEK